MAQEKNPRRVADNEAQAKSKMLRTSPQKLNLVAAMIRGKKVENALADLTFSKRRDLRDKAFKAWTSRGENGGATDNRAIIAETVKLRAERGRLMGFPSYAHFRIADTMAKTPEAVAGLLARGRSPVDLAPFALGRFR